MIQDHVDEFAGGQVALDCIEEANELLVAMALHAAANHIARQHIERREQGGRAVPLVVVRHRAAAPTLERQPRLRAVERLDLALLIDRQHHGIGWRVDIEGRRYRAAWRRSWDHWTA